METKTKYWTVTTLNGNTEVYNSKEYDIADFLSNLHKVPCVIFRNKFKDESIYYPVRNLLSFEIEER